MTTEENKPAPQAEATPVKATADTPKATPVSKAEPAKEEPVAAAPVKAAAKPAAKKPAPKSTAAKAPAKPKAATKAAPKAAPKAAAKPKPKAAPKPAPAKTELPSFDVDLEQFTTQIQEGYNEMFEFGKEQMEKFFKVEGVDAFKSYEDVMAMSKKNVDAYVKSSSIAAKGVQDVASLVAEITKSAIEGNVEASKKIFECKTPQEVAELQTAMLKDGYEKFMADANRISEASTKIAEEAIKPLKEVYDASVEKLNEKVA